MAACAGVVAAQASAGPAPEPTKPTAAAAIKVMPLGDSITWGYTRKFGRPVVVDGYRKDLRERLRLVPWNVDFVGSCPQPTFEPWKCNGRGTMADYQHEGHSGYRIDQLSSHVQTWLRRYQPDVVLLMAGTNDVAQRYRLSTAPARLSALIDKIRAVRPRAHIFVGTIPQMRDSRRPLVDAYNSALPRVVASKDARVRLVPQHLVGRQAKDMVEDNVHPSDCGYAKISYLWYHTMDQYFARGAWRNGYYPWSNSGVCAGH